MLRATVVERGRICRQNGEVRPANHGVWRCYLPAVLYDRLMAAESKRQEKGRERIFQWSHQYADVGPWVGVIQVAGLQLEILPKIEGKATAAEGETDRARKNLLRMLAYAGAVPLRQRDVAALEMRKAPLHELLAELYCRRLQEELLRGMDRAYVVREEERRSLKGRLMVAKQARHAKPDRFSCRYEELSEETALNQVFRAACKGLVNAGRFEDEVRRCLLLLEDVPDHPDPCGLVPKILLNRQNERFSDVFGLAKLILLGLSPTVRAGPQESFALLFEMDKLFEGFIAQFLKQKVLIGTGVELNPQAKDQKRYLLEGGMSSPKRALHLNPDLLFTLPGGKQVVMDTKWKMLDQKTKMPKPEDLYQLYAYSHRFDSAQSFLVYPWVDKMAPWTLPAKGKGDVHVGDVGIRFVRMDHALHTSSGRDALAEELWCLVANAFGLPPEHPNGLWGKNV